ncbi:MAG: acylneuraminate cytidylyltransferase family protein [Silvanigrellales bacterium]|jgi:CMP-N,N'-diacetyllegionaminic acid synthase|nr:acylneuraminate cytidylyltransferase family protein [Silvanigrellales bacterium]
MTEGATPRVLALVPARGGSKGIPRKNLVEVHGKPLIAWTIEPMLSCLNSGLLVEGVISTDDDEIACTAFKFGARVPFIRPPELASDAAKSLDVILHALDFFEERGCGFDSVILLQPTSPQRTAEDIRSALRVFHEEGRDSLISVYEEDHVNELMMYRKGIGNAGSPLSPFHNKGIRRQDNGPRYVRNGAIYISSKELLRRGTIIGDEPTLFVMPRNRSINLDSMADLELLRRSW